MLRHDKDLRMALWIAYILSGQQIDAGTGRERVDCFRIDPRDFDLDKKARPVDYEEPRFDQGHLAPTGDLRHDDQKQVDSCVYSNIAPQEDCFN